MHAGEPPFEWFHIDANWPQSPATADAAARAAASLGASGLAAPDVAFGVQVVVELAAGTVAGTSLTPQQFAKDLSVRTGAVTVEWGPLGSEEVVVGTVSAETDSQSLIRSVFVFSRTFEQLGVRPSAFRSILPMHDLRRIDANDRSILVAETGAPANWSLASRPVIGLTKVSEGLWLEVWTREGHATGRANAWRSGPDLIRRWSKVVEFGRPTSSSAVEEIRSRLDDRSSLWSTVERVVQQLGGSEVDAARLQAIALAGLSESTAAELASVLGLPPEAIELLEVGTPDGEPVRAESFWRRALQRRVTEPLTD